MVRPGPRRGRARPKNAQPALTSLPAPGRLLVTSPEGPWIVHQDGSQRLLGDYQEAAWSPSGLFVAVSRGRQLSAVDPVGDLRWSLAARRPVSNPAWSPSGSPVAYLSGSSLRVVAGDGTGDRPLADRVAAVTPAWRPLRDPVPAGQVAIGPKTNLLAYVDRRDTGDPARRRRRRAALAHRSLCGADPRAAMVRGPHAAPRGPRLLLRLPRHPRPSDQQGDLADARRQHVAGQRPNRLHPAGHSRPQRGAHHRPLREGPPRTLLTRPGRITDPTWSPDGKWLLVARPDADQWLFIRPSRRGPGRDRRQHLPPVRPRRERPAAFPRISGWAAPLTGAAAPPPPATRKIRAARRSPG